MGPRIAVLLALLLLVVPAAPAAAAGEIYTWTDARGHIHATRNLLEVPRAYRADARRRAEARGPSRLQTFPSPGPLKDAPQATSAMVSGTVLEIPFQRRGTLMVVDVVVNDQVRAPFLVDTGASGVSIPYAVVHDLGMRIDSDTPRMAVQTAAGVVSEPVLQLDSIQLGAARVEGVEALVNSAMEIGLLGGSFFNNFVYQVDAARQVITLRPNDSVRSGMTASQWRARFHELHGHERSIARYLEHEGLAEARRDELEASLDRVRASLDALEREANAAGVPRGWRE